MMPTEERIQQPGGIGIFVRSWTPASPRAIVAICHGFNSHSGYYRWVAERLLADGYTVFALDLRGRGQSDGERFYVDDIRDYSSDLSALIALAKSRHPGLPVFLLGHSAGGVTGCVYVLDHQLAGFICESFAYQVPAPDVAIALLKGISHLTPHAHVLRLKNEDFSRDPAVVKAMNDDPLIHDEAQPTKTVAALANADERLKQEFPRITLPVLILHGTADKATKPEGSKTFHAQASSTDKTLKLYEGHYHDLLNDLDKEKPMSDIAAWIAARVP